MFSLSHSLSGGSSGSDHQVGASCEESRKIVNSSDDLRKLMEMVLLNKKRE